jgi:hypothetical protein
MTNASLSFTSVSDPVSVHGQHSSAFRWFLACPCIATSLDKGVTSEAPLLEVKIALTELLIPSAVLVFQT